MKKFVSLLIAVLIIFASVVSGFAESGTNDNDITAERFAANISNLISTSDVADGMPGENETDCEFSTARLIVKSKKAILLLFRTVTIS